MSKSSRGRLPKNIYLKLKEQFTSSFCHKSKNIKIKNKFISDISYNSNKDYIVCVCCKKELVNKIDYSEREYSHNHNCCYDCDFSYFCNDCCFKFNDFKCCGISFMKQLIYPDYGGGLHSNLPLDLMNIFRRKLFKEIKYAKRYGLNKNVLKGVHIIIVNDNKNDICIIK